MALRGALSGTAHWRAWCVWVFWTDAALRGAVQVDAEAGEMRLEVPTEPGADVDRVRAANVLATTPVLVARVFGWQGERPREDVIVTSEREVGIIPLVVRAAVSFGVRVRWAAAASWIATEVVSLVDSDRSRQAGLAELSRSDAAARALVEAHVEREEHAGKALPLDEATKSALGALAARQSKVAEALGRSGGVGSSLPSWLVPVALGAVVLFAGVSAFRG